MKKLCWLLAALLCIACASAMATENECLHPSVTAVADDDMFHQLVCDVCKEVCDMQVHSGMGSGTYIDEETCSFTCADCGYTSDSHTGGFGASDEGYHGLFCMYCNECYGNMEYCYDECTEQDGRCDMCGAETLNVSHNDLALSCTPNGETHTVICGDCGQVAYEWPVMHVDTGDDIFHRVGCRLCLYMTGIGWEEEMHTGMGSGTYIDEDTCSFTCAECGYTSDSHTGGIGTSDEGYHGLFCMYCNECYGNMEYCYDECTEQDGRCDMCGAETLNVSHNDLALSCTPNGETHTVICGDCGQVAYEWPVMHVDTGDDMLHRVGCRLCLYMTGIGWEEEMHAGMGSGTYIDEETCSFTCADCGFTHNGSHNDAMGVGNGFHGTSCYFCDCWTWKETCYEECTEQDGYCDECGAEAQEVRHFVPEFVSNGDGSHTAFCSGCEENLYTETCCAYCNTSGKCNACGGDTANYSHQASESEIVSVSISDTQHRTYCPRCKDVSNYVADHILEGTDNGDGTHTVACTECDYTAVLEHALDLEPGDEENHIYKCAGCDYSKAEAHDLGDETYVHNADGHYIPCQICSARLFEGDHANSCDDRTHCMFCEGEYTSETIHHLFDLSNIEYDDAGHWYTCLSCEEPQQYEEHSYDGENADICQVCGSSRACQHAFWSRISPAPTCTEVGWKVVRCQYCFIIESLTVIPATGHSLTVQDMGEYILESCENCDYEVRYPVKAADEQNEMIVTVLEEEVSLDVQLPEGKEIMSLFTVEYIGEDHPDGKITVILTFTEEELAALENAELVQILEDGTTLALVYEVKDGQVIFETEALGNFAFII